MSNPREVKVDTATYKNDVYGWMAEDSDGDIWRPRWETTEVLDALLAMQAERDEARELVFDVFRQACADDDVYDHYCVSAYEDAQAALIEWGTIKAEQCRRTT